MKTMTSEQAREYVAIHNDDDPMESEDLVAAFTALYGHAPDNQDHKDGLWSLCCAAV